MSVHLTHFHTRRVQEYISIVHYDTAADILFPQKYMNHKAAGLLYALVPPGGRGVLVPCHSGNMWGRPYCKTLTFTSLLNCIVG